jgi:hypothetical protein
MFLRCALAALALCASAGAWAGMAFCDRAPVTSPDDQDRVLRFAAAVKQELDQSGAQVALIARAGLDLGRFGLLYSHAGIALKGPDGAWTVRQLYYACDEARPRLFDQGISGFALSADTPAHGHVAVVLLPPAQAAQLAAAAQDKRLALALLGGEYSANAYAFSTRYQNCNQWVIELMAQAWGQLPASDAPREDSQRWLRAQGYAAGPVHVGSHWLMFAAQFVPLVHVRDHPVEDLQSLDLHVSVPDAIESFIRQRVPGARRIELCHDSAHIAVHEGWDSAGARCVN